VARPSDGGGRAAADHRTDQQGANVKIDLTPGRLYLLHIEPPYKHAKHYLGYSEDLPARLRAHAAGNGARLIAVATAAGCEWQLARVWIGDRRLERSKKKCGKTRSCPICRPDLRVPNEQRRLLRVALAELRTGGMP
jgi:hypothetical protein